jgi:PAS domain S-box-containing protein
MAEDLARSKAELAESERTFRTLATHAPVGIFQSDADGNCLFVNERWCEITGLGVDEAAGPGWAQGLHAEDRARVFSRLHDAGAETRGALEYPLRTPPGRETWVMSHLVALRDETGAPRGYLGTISDITERKRMEQAVRDSEMRWRALIENASDVIAVLGRDGRVRYASPSVGRLLGWTEADLAGPYVSRIVHPDDAAAAARLFTACLARPGSQRGEICVRHKDGSWRWFEVVATNALEDGTIRGVIVNSRDVTERHRAEAALRRIKSEFLANVSHEVRAPLTALLGATRLALDTPLTAEQREYLDIVNSSTDVALAVISDILDFAEIEAGRLTLDVRPFRLGETLGVALRSVSAQAQAKGIELLSDVGPDVPDALRGDPHRLRQVLQSLLGNAVKFTEKGEVVVRIGVQARGLDDVQLVVTVADTGPGIPLERQETLFDPFAISSDAARKTGGTGLGLAIAGELVQLMGGVIWVESAVGQGSSFHFTARCEIEHDGFAAVGPPAPRHAAVGGARILIAEDTPANRLVATRLLERRGFRVVAVENGRDAVHAAAADHFDVVIMDILMPEMDGLAAAAAIRAAEAGTGRRVPIVALTAHALAGDHDRCLAAGMDAYIAKPFKSEELFAVLGRLLPAGSLVEDPDHPAFADDAAPAAPAPTPATALDAVDATAGARDAALRRLRGRRPVTRAVGRLAARFRAMLEQIARGDGPAAG